MSRLAALFAFTALACGAGAVSCPPTDPKPPAPTGDLALMQGIKRHCGAVAIGPFAALTAEHCVDPLKVYSTKSNIGLTPIYFEPHKDLVWLRASQQLPAWRERRTTPIKVGERLCLKPVEAPEVASNRKCGRVTGIEFRLWRLNVTVTHGWSGTPAIDQDGSVAGLVSKCRARNGRCYDALLTPLVW